MFVFARNSFLRSSASVSGGAERTRLSQKQKPFAKARGFRFSRVGSKDELKGVQYIVPVGIFIQSCVGVMAVSPVECFSPNIA